MARSREKNVNLGLSSKVDNHDESSISGSEASSNKDRGGTGNSLQNADEGAEDADDEASSGWEDLEEGDKDSAAAEEEEEQYAEDERVEEEEEGPEILVVETPSSGNGDDDEQAAARVREAEELMNRNRRSQSVGDDSAVAEGSEVYSSDLEFAGITCDNDLEQPTEDDEDDENASASVSVVEDVEEPIRRASDAMTTCDSEKMNPAPVHLPDDTSEARDAIDSINERFHKRQRRN